MDRKIVALLDPEMDKECITTLSCQYQSHQPPDQRSDPSFEKVDQRCPSSYGCWIQEEPSRA